MADAGNLKLMEPITVGGMTLRNRIVMPPMENIYNNADGSVSEDQIAYYAARAGGGVGLIIIQNTHIDTCASRSAYGMLSIATGHMIAGLSRLAEAIHLRGAKAVIQLGHGGRQCNPDALPPGVQSVAPSPVPCFVWGVVPRELTVREIHEIQDSYAGAAERAQRAGLDGVEVHSAHGYLIGQFISPLSNRRTDEYGGSLENRARFVLEIIEKVRAKVGPDFTVGFRMSADEYVPGGLDAQEGVQYAKIVADTGKIDYISVSAGTYESIMRIYPVMYEQKGCLLHLAEGIKGAVKDVPIIAVGALDAEQGEKALREQKADLIAIGRGLIADPDLPNKIATGRTDDIRPCIRCNEGCFTTIANGRPMRCSVNPTCGRERTAGVMPAGTRKKVIVVGGGIAGMEAARVAALRGHSVTLMEKGDRLGGHLIEASRPPFKKPIQELLDWAMRQVGKGDVTVRLNTEVTPESVAALKPDAVIVAVGSDWDSPFVSDNPPVVTGDRVLTGDCVPGEQVVVIGGGTTGCEVALYVAQVHRRKVTVVEMLPAPMIGMEILHMMTLMERLVTAGVDLKTGMKVTRIGDGAVVCEGADGTESTFTADTVVFCTGLHARDEQAASFTGAAPRVHIIGDCREAKNILSAFEDAHRAVLSL